MPISFSRPVPLIASLFLTSVLSFYKLEKEKTKKKKRRVGVLKKDVDVKGRVGVLKKKRKKKKEKKDVDVKRRVGVFKKQQQKMWT